MQALRHEIENYSWEVIQNMIEKEISSAFKLKEPPITKPIVTMPSKKEIKQIIKKTVIEQRKTI
jgi:hypothetical protein